MSFLFASPNLQKADENKSAKSESAVDKGVANQDAQIGGMVKTSLVSHSPLTAAVSSGKMGGGSRGSRKVIKDLTTGRLADPKSCIQRVFSTETPIGFRLASGDNTPFNAIQSFVNLTTISSSTTLEVDTGFSFSASTLGVSASATGFFDQYRIMEIEVLFVQRRQATVATANPGSFAVVVDYDNNTTAALSVLDNYANVNIGSGIESFYVRFVPHIASSIATTAGGVVSGGNLARQWIDSANTTVAHFGVKTAWSTTTDIVYTKDVHVRAWIQFRNVF